MGENRELCTCDYRAAQRSTRCQPSCIYIQQRCFILSATVFSYIQHLHCLPQWSAAYLKASLVMFCKKYKFHWEPYSIVLLRLNYGCDVCPDWRLNGVCDCNSVCLRVCVCVYKCMCLCMMGPTGSDVIEQEALSSKVDEMCKKMAGQTWR